MKSTLRILILAIFFALNFIPSQAWSTEDWKGEADPAEFNAGVLTGLGVVNSQAGFALMATGAKRILKQGFVPDINNSVWIETELGPVFVSGGTAFAYSAHLRWDFVKDQNWTLYAVGGLGGLVTGSDLGDHFELFPRFGVGAMAKLTDLISLRGEVSHELTAVGVSFAF
jgi:hypothetical protein